MGYHLCMVKLTAQGSQKCLAPGCRLREKKYCMGPYQCVNVIDIHAHHLCQKHTHCMVVIKMLRNIY